MSSIPQWKAGRLSKESEASKMIYNYFLKRNSAYVTTIFAVAIVGGIAFDKVMDTVWESSNKGKLWKDVKNNFGGDE
eukprot:CAMPEP_0119414462 /NCGR_PEP_ID=MMETSP1335-20130426/6999_1 /TAXON_ID=259385 /ORGANISM="Chrysoculter rhomboideus, Strain RCC1486" /LENGTH=76 /DNA_ID=CAMNT_0007439343 /DNA_START=53 /DNA_END=283 /DNA_ORIENTATION=-